MASGQSIVEFALIFPLMCFAALGFFEAGMLLAQKAQQDRDTAVVADYAASHPGDAWQAIAARLLPSCTLDVSEASDLVTATSTCQYRGRVTSGLLDVPISSSESAVVEAR